MPEGWKKTEKLEIVTDLDPIKTCRNNWNSLTEVEPKLQRKWTGTETALELKLRNRSSLKEMAMV
jgi:hypothetical protein